jgi:indole-3-glycerol phosphate synthase
VYEARAAGSDCILLIAAMLSESVMRELEAVARELKMDVLVEVHDEAEFATAQKIGATLVGINNRDLHTFATELAVTERLLSQPRRDALIVSESGINAPEDIARLDRAGARAFLIGESLLRGGEPRAKLAALLGALRAGDSR